MTCERISQDSEGTLIIKQSFIDSFKLSFFSPPCGMCKTSILHCNILLSICCKGKLWDNACFLIKVGEFLAEVIGKIFEGGEEYFFL